MPKENLYTIVTIIYFDYSLSCLNLWTYSPNSYFSENRRATATAMVIKREIKRDIMEYVLIDSLIYWICIPAEKLMLNILKMIKVRRTYFKMYLDILCQKEALYFIFTSEAY